MSRLMYDAVSPANIPADAEIVAGYIDGHYQWTPADWARFPNAVHVPIAVFASTMAGVVLDVERYDAAPQQAPGWVRERRFNGIDPTVYCSLDPWPEVRRAFIDQQVPEPHYWIAQYTGSPHLVDGSVATQWDSPGPYDVSLVADFWPGVDTGEPMPLSQADVDAIGANVQDRLTHVLEDLINSNFNPRFDQIDREIAALKSP